MLDSFKDKAKVSLLLKELELPKSSFYYRATNKRRGRRPLGYTFRKDDTAANDKIVVSDIKRLLEKEFVCYGYLKVTHHLKRHGYIINKKKVYRLMKEQKLLLGKRIRTSGKRNFVKMMVVTPTEPHQHLQMDIKYFWITGERKNAYLLSILDVFSRKVLGWKLGRSLKKKEVLALLKKTFADFQELKGVSLRNDNGSQFLAHRVRDYLKELGVYQEFTHIATPQENSHIEALHSVLEAEVVKRFEFESFEHLEDTLKRYFRFYNEERIHSSIGFKTPQNFLDEYYVKELMRSLKEKSEDLNLCVKI